MPAGSRLLGGAVLKPLFLLLLLGLTATVARGADPVGGMHLLSVGMSGEPAVRGAGAGWATISRNGRFVVFQSDAQDYAPVKPGSVNVFVKDLVTGDADLVSQSTGGVPADGWCYPSQISGNGRYVVFHTGATNLIDGVEQQPGSETYLRDRVARTTERISRPEDGGKGPSGGGATISDDGRYVVRSYPSRIVLQDRLTGALEPISVRSDNTPFPRITGFSSMTPDARFFAFLVPYESGSGSPDVLWLRDRVTGTTELVSVEPDRWPSDVQDASLSDDGRFVLYRFWSGGEIIPAVRDRQTGALQLFRDLDYGPSSLSADGSTILYESFWASKTGDSLLANHFWLVSRETGEFRELTLTPSGGPAHAGARPARLFEQVHGGGISATPDLRTIVFSTELVDLVEGDTNGRPDVFVWSASGAPLQRVSVRPDGSETNSPAEFQKPVQTPDGRFVAFATDARDLAPGDVGGMQDVYVLDRKTGLFDCATRSTSGASANDNTARDDEAPAITPDGHYVAYSSYATNLGEGDTNGNADVFLHDRWSGTTTRVSLDAEGKQLPSGVYAPPAISADGRYVTLSSCDPLDGRPVVEDAIFIRDRRLGRIERVTVSTIGQPLQGYFGVPTLSADGRYVAFTYQPLEGLPGHKIPRILVRDRLRRTTEEVPGSRECYGGLSASSDLRYVAFPSDRGWTGNRRSYDKNGIVVTDRVLGTSQRTSMQDNGDDFPFGTWEGALSPDGGFLAFTTDLPDPEHKDWKDAVYLRDRRTRRTYLISRALDGKPATSYLWDRPVSVSNGGRHVVFTFAEAQLVEGGPSAGKHLYALDRD